MCFDERELRRKVCVGILTWFRCYIVVEALGGWLTVQYISDQSGAPDARFFSRGLRLNEFGYRVGQKTKERQLKKTW